MFHTAYFCTERLRQKSSCTLLILPHGRGKLRHVVGKVEHGWKKRTSSFPGRGEEWALLFTPWHTYLWQSFFPPSKSDCFKPSNNSSSFLSRKKSFYPSDNLQITYNLCNQQRKTISYHFYSAETSAAQFGFRQRRQQWLIRLIFPQVKMAHLARPVAIFD